MLKSLMENLAAMGCDPAAVDGVTVKINAPAASSPKSHKITGYTIKSISDEGKYYLINGWYKHWGFWLPIRAAVNAVNIEKITFKTIASAKSSLTKLLKIMPDYAADNFILCGITESENIIDLEDLKK